MGRKLVLTGSITLVSLFTLLAIIGLWNSNGGVLTFLAGQSSPEDDYLKGFDNRVPKKDWKSYRVAVEINTQKPIHRVDEEYLSFALDSSQLVGGKWWNPKAREAETGSGTFHAPVFDFDRPRLDLLTRALTPAYLRLGGSEADKIFYDVEDKYSKPPEGYESLMKMKHWDSMIRYVKRNNLKLMFTVNAGPSSRTSQKVWKNENALSLLNYAAHKKQAVEIWELGNEINLFWFIYGPDKQVNTDQYSDDLRLFRKTVHSVFPGATVNGQGAAFWPILGEPVQFFYAFTEEYLKNAGEQSDTVSWHYYPQQSRRGLIASRRAHPAQLLDPHNLDEAAHWAKKIIQWRDAFAPGKPIWMGESGNAQFGGEPGVSDRYIGGLWWLDELGLLATLQHNVIVRQTLTGMNYGMIDNQTLIPKPDYWNSYLFKKLMGRQVLEVTKDKGENQKARLYAHCSPSKTAITLLALNLSEEKVLNIQTSQFAGKEIRAHILTTSDVLSEDLFHNNRKFELKNEQLPDIKGMRVKEVKLSPLSYGFFQIRGDFPACN